MAMTETNKAHEEQEEERGKSLRTIEVIAVLFFLLNLVTSLVMMLLPLKVLGGAFPGRVKGLWLMFILSLGLMILLNALSAPKDNRRKYWKFFGTVNVILGFLCAAEIFYLRGDGKTYHASLWWLPPVLTVLGTTAVYLTERFKRLEREKAKREQEEALAKKRKTIPTVVRLKVRRYYVTEGKTVVCDN